MMPEIRRHNFFLNTVALIICLLFLNSCIFQNKPKPKDKLSLISESLQRAEKKNQTDLELDYFGKTVIALYKSSGGETEKENMILYHLSIPLSKMGLTIKYWDIDRGFPDALVMQNVRAIITWFGSSSLEYPLEYLDFLDKAIDSGRKLIVFDNFGAWEKKIGGKTEDVDSARVNLTLSKLGLWYVGNWTNDSSQIQIGEKIPGMVEAEAPIDIKEAAFYYRFLPVDSKLKVYLSLKINNKPEAPSPVIVSNRNGGFVLSNYIYRKIDGKIKFLINIEKFLQESLFPGNDEEYIGLMADTDSRNTKKILSYVNELLSKSKIPYSIIPKSKFESLMPGDLRRFSSIGLIVRSDEKIEPKVIDDYLNNGGSIVSLLGGAFKNIADLLGSSPVEIKGILEKVGYRLKPGFALSEGVGLRSDSYRWQVGEIVPAKDSIILATANGDDYPLLWSALRGKGKVLVWNWDGFTEAEIVGLTLESFLYVRPFAACATLGDAHMFLDDWPLSMYNTVKAPLKITDTEFYTKVWWPDIKQLLESSGIPYSAFLIINYNEKVTPPFTGGEFFTGENMASPSITRSLLSSGIEIGLHGYNHMSLTLDKTHMNTNSWHSIDDMEGSLIEGKKVWSSLFGSETLPFAYVAVNNIISEDGIIALHEIFPSIRVISALKWGIEEETYTDIGPHPYIPNIYYIPRISSGYQSETEVLNLISSGADGFGFVSHFIHPDDVFDPKRSSDKSWEVLQKEFKEILQYIKSNYPWITWKSLREIYHDLIDFDSLRCSFKVNGNKLEINSRIGTLIRLRTDGKEILHIEGARISYEYENMPVTIVETTKPLSKYEFSQ